MKDPTIAYKEGLEDMLNLVKEGQYGNCFNIAKNLTNFSWTMELKDEVFTSEILEAIFSQMNDTIKEYKMPDPAKDELKSSLSKWMEEVIDAYNVRDLPTLYTSLKELRYAATYTQLNAWQKYPKNSNDYGDL